MTDKNEWIQLLREMYTDWEDFLAVLSEAQVTARDRVDELSIKDIIAHLTAWQKISAARLEAGLHGGEPDFSEWPQEFDFVDELNVDHINAWIFDQYKENSWPMVYQEWKARYQKVIGLTEAVPEADLLEAAKYPWLRHYALAAVLEGTYNHHREHLADLHALIKRD
jgi:hypothetical protein